MFLTVADQVVQCKAVMGSDEIYAVERFSPVPQVEIGAAGYPGSQVGDKSRVRSPEMTYIVLEPIVPLAHLPPGNQPTW